jgi:AcrR family transcriptional regulator
MRRFVPYRLTMVAVAGTARQAEAEPGSQVRRLGTSDRSSQRIRIVDAALACVARQGLSRTTLDDIAAGAGVSRATVYRVFPGGRDAVLAATVETEVARLFSELAVMMGEADDLEEALVAGIVTAARRLGEHPALAALLAHEPGVVLAQLCFDRFERVLEVASGFAAPFLTRWLEPDQATRAAEWATRIVVSYLVTPGRGLLEVTDRDDVAALVRRYVVPGVLALRPLVAKNARSVGPRARGERATGL